MSEQTLPIPDVPATHTLYNLYADLQSDDRWTREAAIKKLGDYEIKTDENINLLRYIAENDRNPYPRRAARLSLAKLGVNPPPGRWFEMLDKVNKTPAEKSIDVAIGFVSWFVVAGIFWTVFGGPSIPRMCAIASSLCGLSLGVSFMLEMVVYGVSVIILWMSRRWASYGVMAAYALNFLLSWTLGVSSFSMLGVPFFLRIAWNY